MKSSKEHTQLLAASNFALLNKRSSTALTMLKNHRFPCLEAPKGNITLSCRPKDSAWFVPFDLPPLQKEETEDHERWKWTKNEEIRIDLLQPIDAIECDSVCWFAATQGSQFSDHHVRALQDSPLIGAEIDWAPVTETGLRELCSITTLQYLDISWTRLETSSLQSIGNLSSLHCLKLNGSCRTVR